MNYLLQFAIILGFSFLGEVLHLLLPWPIPASIYGLVLLFLALQLKLVKREWVQDTGHYLVNIMGVMFVCPVLGLLTCLDVIRENLVSVLVITIASLLITFSVSGVVTQWLLNRKEGKEHV